ncbi:TIGR00153 family protein [Microvenator marinus]|jgi:predicted phosphate transport protein (TIGR00153 family)|uniref:TIGR00153 family protein n=1 Tax=Microvenator marinus TaxID=2600177 RepID=A0A5B8XX09_9DELT|nr:TIGR00153 family protein [Microvenator marinus]QED30155.1 TIGR00153 family protein [Microvenator marinus]
MMVRSIFSLFAKSPFTPLIDLANTIEECCEQVPVLFDAFFQGNYERVKAISEQISHLEHEADVKKHKLRDELPRTLFLPVDRRDFLDVLSSLDAIADCAEDVGILFTLREMEPHEELMAPLKSLVRRVMSTVHHACEIVRALDTLAEAGFEGQEAKKVLAMIDELGRLEHEADIVQDDLARRLFAIEDNIKPGSLLIWNKIFNKVGDMANHAERMGNRLRLFIAS